MSFLQKLQHWLGGTEPNLSYISFDTLGWPEYQRTPYQIQWRSQDLPGQLSLNYFSNAPDLPNPLSDFEKLAHFYRQKLKNQQGGIIHISSGRTQDFRLIETLFKIPQKGHPGYIYVSSFTLPFADRSYVIKLQIQEYTHVGERERVVEEGLRRDGLFDDKPWSQDPYDLGYEGTHLMNRSEEPRFDLFFPDHPLSQVRQFMLRIQHSLSFAPELSQLEPVMD